MSENAREYIPRKLYEAGFPDRIMESELTIGGLYTVLFAFKNRNHEYAAQFSTRISELNLDLRTISKMGMVLLDQDLQPYREEPFTGNIVDGRISFKGHPTLQVYEEPISEGYFKNYEDPFGFDLELFQAIDVSNFVSA